MHELVAEATRLSRALTPLLNQTPPETELPLRLHSRDIDAGGGPAFHPEFMRYLGNASVCKCGRAKVCDPSCHYDKDGVLGHLDACEPACRDDLRFHGSKNKNHPQRMNRALRAVRRLNPRAYDLCYLVVARGYTFDQAAAKLNADYAVRGQPELSAAQFAVLWVSGGSLLASLA